MKLEFFWQSITVSLEFACDKIQNELNGKLSLIEKPHIEFPE